MEQRKFLILVVLGLFNNISFLVVVVECLSENEFNLSVSQSLPPPPPIQDFAPLTPPPPPPPPPPAAPSPPPPFVPPPPPQSPPPPPPAPRHPPPPPPPRRPQLQPRHNRTRKFNFGEKMGLTFVCVGGFLQIGVISFLGFKRWQISKIRDRG